MWFSSFSFCILPPRFRSMQWRRLQLSLSNHFPMSRVSLQKARDDETAYLHGDCGFADCPVRVHLYELALDHEAFKAIRKNICAPFPHSTFSDTDQHDGLVIISPESGIRSGQRYRTPKSQRCRHPLSTVNFRLPTKIPERSSATTATVTKWCTCTTGNAICEPKKPGQQSAATKRFETTSMLLLLSKSRGGNVFHSNYI